MNRNDADESILSLFRLLAYLSSERMFGLEKGRRRRRRPSPSLGPRDVNMLPRPAPSRSRLSSLSSFARRFARSVSDTLREMTSPARVLKSVAPKLVPFFKSVAVYYVLFIPIDKPSVWAMFVKIAPILSLMFFVLLHGMSLGDEYMFSRRILIGLIFSCFGDALLVWPNYFLHGMCAFGIAQIFYIRAFGFEDLKLYLVVPLYSIMIYFVSMFSPQTLGVYKIGVPVYSTLLMTMVWRAIARVRFSRNQWTWTEICSCVGGIFFSLSDAAIGYDRFYSNLSYAQVLIMTTYYMAQLGIALSVVDSSSVYKLSQQKLLEKEDIANFEETQTSPSESGDNRIKLRHLDSPNSDIKSN